MNLTSLMCQSKHPKFGYGILRGEGFAAGFRRGEESGVRQRAGGGRHIMRLKEAVGAFDRPQAAWLGARAQVSRLALDMNVTKA
ncbi:hypothetical protein EVAR_16641_1 [Eumeta japonica]|uniref:Uncharacterized protein n=1 Tax=Eumeta variegata TaxID=151549 RepID=A0A4C1V0S0_EUMVA|nr:hypothetical protein EVAR_16641_1 [Eumeta japonica]